MEYATAARCVHDSWQKCFFAGARRNLIDGNCRGYARFTSRHLGAILATQYGRGDPCGRPGVWWRGDGRGDPCSRPGVWWRGGGRVLLQQANAEADKHAVIRPGLWRLSTAGSAMLLGFCATLLVARALGPALFGRYAFAAWLATAAAPAAGAGMSALTSRAVANIQSREKPH